MTNLARRITGGVDTHLHVHVAAALDERGALLGAESFTTTTEGYKLLLGWLSDFGPVELVGVEGTGPMEPGSPVISRPNGSESSKSTVPTDNAAGARASRTPKTPSPPPVPPSRATPAARPRAGTETSNPCGYCGSRGRRPARDGPRRSTRYATWSRRRPIPSGLGVF